MSYVCLHERTEVRWRNRSVGLIGRQCLDCGRAAGNWLGHEGIDTASLTDWAEEAEPPAVEMVQLAGVEDRKARGVSREEYGAYLASETWRRRRDKVMARANGVCEGCLTQPAADVHHLTYAHIFAEFAFELIALCRPCHERIHNLSEQRAEVLA